MIKQVKLKDVASHSKGKQINGDDLIKNGTYDYLNGGINPSGKWNGYNTESDTVTISEGGNSSGYVNFMINPFWCGTHCYYLYNLKIQPKYLYYALKSQENRLMSLRTGAAMPNIKKSTLGEFVFQIDDNSNNQNQIVSILDSVSNIILKKNKQLSDYDQLIKSRFVEMFGDIFNGKSNYSTIKISEAVVPKIERAKKDFNADDEIKYLDISSVDNRKNIIIGYTDYLMKDAPSRAQQHVRKDDIVISTVRPNLNNVAKVTHDYSNIVASSGFCVLRASKVEPNFLFALVSMQSFADYLASLTTGANYPAVSDKDILNFEIPNAPFEEQTKFSDFIKQVDKLKFSVQQSLDESQKLFDSLMQEYFG